MRNGEWGVADRQSTIENLKRLAVVLSALFVLAVVIGAGPGIYLINPNPADPDAVFTVLGMPVIYAWGRDAGGRIRGVSGP